MKYFIALILFSACGQKKQINYHWGFSYDKERDQGDIVIKDTAGNWNTIKINWEDSTVTVITEGKNFKQTTRVRLKDRLYKRKEWSNPALLKEFEKNKK